MVHRKRDPREALVLRLPRAEDETAARRAHQQGLNFGRWVTDGQSWADYLVRLRRTARGWTCRPGWWGPR